jgi:hypothetical protein
MAVNITEMPRSFRLVLFSSFIMNRSIDLPAELAADTF